ncbi:Glu/Leu/Phe/Val family dehydrogenase [Marinobacterium aestuariivivens]|uniref:Glu/Leu/Phe/Val dehydrogenase n=1 Tax=Marinobacterium aestuariivivens TaxID=1698799 RepID=A0ABW2A6V4_9GAMM
MRVAIQGFGNGGYHAGRLLQQDGYRIVAVSDSKGAIYSDEGFDIERLWQVKQQSRKVSAVYCEGSVCETKDHEEISNAELLALDVDLLIPAALEGVIDCGNVERIRAGTIVEIANGPVRSDAEAALAKRNIRVVPDVLANAGGVTVSYFEWVQNRSGYPWSLERVREELKRYMTLAFDETFRIAEEQGRTLRNAAYLLALQRIADAMRAHGTQEYFQNGKD